MSPMVQQGFTNIDGEHYSNIREITYEDKKSFEDFGKCVFVPSPYKPDGAYIYQSFDNPKIAHKIYKDYDGFRKDDRLISKLVAHQKNIKLTDFPTGVVTVNGIIVGQETGYYENAPTIFDFSKVNHLNALDFLPTELYLSILRAIKEMFENGIFYFDTYGGNCVVLPFSKNANPIVKVIDFSPEHIDFYRISKEGKKMIFDDLCNLVNCINRNFGLTDKCYEINNEHNSFDETEEKIIKMGELLQKRC